MARGLGPARRAEATDLEATLQRGRDEGTVTEQDGIDLVIVASLWMLRGAEVAAVLGEQVSFAEAEDAAAIELGRTRRTRGAGSAGAR